MFLRKYLNDKTMDADNLQQLEKMRGILIVRHCDYFRIISFHQIWNKIGYASDFNQASIEQQRKEETVSADQSSAPGLPSKWKIPQNIRLKAQGGHNFTGKVFWDLDDEE